jgi:DIM1 family U5 snRNP protein
MYELYDPMTIMFFFRNKHMLVDFGTGNNNKMTHYVGDKQEVIDIGKFNSEGWLSGNLANMLLVETVYRGAKKGRGLVVSPKDYSTRYQY